jgi:hypothetical protein
MTGHPYEISELITRMNRAAQITATAPRALRTVTAPHATTGRTPTPAGTEHT